jgi:hypothetical protein
MSFILRHIVMWPTYIAQGDLWVLLVISFVAANITKFWKYNSEIIGVPFIFLPTITKVEFMNLLASGLVFVMNRNIDHTV